MDLPEFLARVRQELALRGWSQSELARRAMVGRETVSKLMTGRRPRPSHTTMLAIAKALDLLEELVEPDYEPADVPDVARRSAPTPTDPGEVYLEGFREGFRQGVAWATRARPPGPPQLQARSLDEAVGHRPEQPAAPAPPGRTRGRRAG